MAQSQDKQNTQLFTIKNTEIHQVSQYIINKILGEKKQPVFYGVFRKTVTELEKKYPFHKLEKPVKDALMRFIGQEILTHYRWGK